MKTRIAIPCMDMVNTLFMQSLLGMRRTGRAEFGIACSSLVYDARNALARKAIVEKFDRVLWLDSDMVFDPDFMERLNADLDAGRDMVSGLYFTRKLPLKPVIFNECGYFRRNEETMEVVPTAKTYYDYPKDSIFEVAACGFGGVLMNVSLLEEVEAKFGLPFAPIVGFGEDISFCLRVSELGKKMYCDSTARMGHVGYSTINEETYVKGLV